MATAATMGGRRWGRWGVAAAVPVPAGRSATGRVGRVGEGEVEGKGGEDVDPGAFLR